MSSKSNKIIIFSFRIFFEDVFCRVKMEEPVPVTGGKIALDESLVLIVEFLLKITLKLQSFILGNKFYVIKSEEIGKWRVCIICKFSLYLLNTVSGQLPPEENCPPVRVGVWVKVRDSFRGGGNQTIVPEKKCPPVRFRVWLWVSLFLLFFWGGCNFPRGKLS